MYEHVSVGCLHLDPDPPRIHELAALLSGDELDRAKRFRFADDRRRFVAARGCLRELLGEELDVHPRALALRYGACGKPFLADRFADSGLQFNLAHCGDVALIATAYGRGIGVDIERLRELEDRDGLVAEHFSQREQLEYADVRPEHRTAAFFHGWTRKEALIKALGDGLSFPLDSFDVSLDPGVPARLHRLCDRTGDDCAWRIHDFPAAAGFVAAVAVECHESDHGVGLREAAVRPWGKPHV